MHGTEWSWEGIEPASAWRAGAGHNGVRAGDGEEWISGANALHVRHEGGGVSGTGRENSEMGQGLHGTKLASAIAVSSNKGAGVSAKPSL